MRCLYCDKELALLKRLRGGGEFCSDAHRQSYQDEFNQLALNRLLQAVPPPDSKPDLVPAPMEKVVPADPVKAPVKAAPVQVVQETPVAVMETETETEEPAGGEPNDDHDLPAMAGFVTDAFAPVQATLEHHGNVELGRMAAAVPELPTRSAAASMSASGNRWPTADPVEIQLHLEARDYSAEVSQHEPEQREMTHTTPVLDIRMAVQNENVPEGDSTALTVSVPPAPPQGAPAPWLSIAPGFSISAPAELGDLARLDFAVMAYEKVDYEVAQPEPQSAPPVQVETFVAEPVQIATTYAEPVVEPTPAPEVVEPVVLEPVAIEPVVIESVQEGAPHIEPPAPPPVPDLVTKPLPMTLHGLAAGRGKAKQIFMSAMPPAFEAQIPGSTALPLRPALVFGPAPSPPETKENKEVKEPLKSAVSLAASQAVKTVVKPEARTAPAPAARRTPEKVRQSEPRTPERVPETPRVAKVPEQSPVTEPVTERAPEPAAEPQIDLGLPTLNLQPSSGFWGKLSMGGKLGVAAGLVAALAGAAYFVSNGGHAPAHSSSTGQKEVVAVPIPSSGWIENWANEAANSKRERRINMLQGTLSLSDYRMEFNAQIENKAVGWVYRAKDARNYYVAKLEVEKAGLDPIVALVHFAVIDGRDQDSAQQVLSMKLRPDTIYKIRFEALGNRFTTWVQDQQIDAWTDAHFDAGGVGMFSERGERAGVQGTVNVNQLVVAKN